MQQKVIAVVMGDGSGPEMMSVACEVAVKAAAIDGFEIVFEETPMGWGAFKKFGDTLPPSSLKRALELGIVFFGGVGDHAMDNTVGKEKPGMKPEVRCLLTLRKEMGLLLNFRPVIFYPELKHLSRLRPEFLPDTIVRQVFVRFLLEDSYFGSQDLRGLIGDYACWKLGIIPKDKITGNEEIVVDLAYYRRSTIIKYLEKVFQYAYESNLPVISIDKANVMPRYQFWRKIVTEVGALAFPGVPLRHELVDAANSFLTDPIKLHGVIACGNEHGDILSDGGISIPGSMGMMHSSAINPDTGAAMFESGAGTAPTLAGTNKANPIGRILSGAMMLRHIGAINGANAIEQAVIRVLTEGYLTADLCPPGKSDGAIGTQEMGQQILSYL